MSDIQFPPETVRLGLIMSARVKLTAKEWKALGLKPWEPATNTPCPILENSMDLHNIPPVFFTAIEAAGKVKRARVFLAKAKGAAIEADALVTLCKFALDEAEADARAARDELFRG